MKGYGHYFGKPPASTEPLREAIDAALKDYPMGAFVRLGSGSAKDSPHVQLHGHRIISGYGALNMLWGSHRITRDLILAAKHLYQPQLIFRPWLQIPPWSELRCFISGRQLVGVSQYYVRPPIYFSELAMHTEHIHGAVLDFFQLIQADLPLDRVVMDILIDKTYRVQLLELNPFVPRTDPCLFSHEKEDWDGSFRYVKSENQ